MNIYYQNLNFLFQLHLPLSWTKLYFILLLLTNPLLFSSWQALVIEPVVDLITEPIENPIFYKQIPVSPTSKKDTLSCIRTHQLLFNEIVTIKSFDKKEVIIEIPNAFYQTSQNDIKNNKFRALKSKFVLINDLKNKKINIKNIPVPIKYNQDHPKEKNQNILVLKFPFKDKITHRIYSAGTRFIYLNKNNITNNSENNTQNYQDYQDYIVYAFDKSLFNFIQLSIPKKLCLANQDQLNKDQKITLFVKLLRKYANLKNGFIPYVWGGNSLCNLSNDQNFIIKNLIFHNKKMSYFELPNFNRPIKTGFDCSGLILRIAQICSIPFYFKNTTTIAQNLKELDKTDQISNGDLIWIPGHIIAISDVENNLCVEARDYSQGYGKVQEIQLNKLFKDIHSFDKLKLLYLESKPIKRLNINGNIIEVLPKFKILKLKSVWH